MIEFINALPVIFIGVGLLSLFPCVAYACGDCPTSLSDIRKILEKNDVDDFLSPDKLASLRELYSSQHRDRKVVAVLWVIIFIGAMFFGFAADFLGVKLEGALEVVVSFAIIVLEFASLYIFGRLGAAYARVRAVMPLNEMRDKEVIELIASTENPEILIREWSKGDRQAKTLLHFLAIKQMAKKITEENEERKLRSIESKLS